MAALLTPVGFEQKLSKCCGAPTHTKQHFNASIVIARTGAMTVEGRAVDSRSIYSALAWIRRAHPDVSLSIYSDAKTPYGTVIRAVDAAKSSSINDVTFIAQ